jgi:5-methylcytosine-specific restriction endonuclease McrA
MPICSKCRKEKSSRDFPKNKARLNGLDSYCLECNRIRQRARYAATHPGRQPRKLKPFIKITEAEWAIRKAASKERARQRAKQKTFDPDEKAKGRIRKNAWRKRNLELARKRDRLQGIRSYWMEKAKKLGGNPMDLYRANLECQFRREQERIQPSPKKKCTKCGEVRPRDQFPARPKSSDGLDSNCKTCRSVRTKNWAQRNRKHLADLARQRYRSSTTIREASHMRSKAAKYKRKAILKTAKSDLTLDQWTAIKAAYGYRCAYCRQQKPLTQDHVIPVSKGGPHTASNIVPACRSCNSSKGANPPKVAFQQHLIA